MYFAAQLAAQIFDIEVARKFVRQAIEEALAVNRRIPEGLSEADLDRIFTYQPVHFEDMGYFVTGSSVRTSRGCGTRYVASVTGAITSGRSSRRHQGQNPVLSVFLANSLQRLSKRQLVAIWIEHVEIAFPPRRVPRDFRV